jgi:hypothetical protein
MRCTVQSTKRVILYHERYKRRPAHDPDRVPQSLLPSTSAMDHPVDVQYSGITLQVSHAQIILGIAKDLMNDPARGARGILPEERSQFDLQHSQYVDTVSSTVCGHV